MEDSCVRATLVYALRISGYWRMENTGWPFCTELREASQRVLEAFPDYKVQILDLCNTSEGFLDLCSDYAKVVLALDAKEPMKGADRKDLCHLKKVLLKEIESFLNGETDGGT